MKLSLGMVCILIAAALFGFAAAQTGYVGQPGNMRMTLEKIFDISHKRSNCILG
jgi:hypothetical protein